MGGGQQGPHPYHNSDHQRGCVGRSRLSRRVVPTRGRGRMHSHGLINTAPNIAHLASHNYPPSESCTGATPPPPNGADATSCTGKLLGTSCTVSCPAGFTGGLSIACGSNGRWGNWTNNCVPTSELALVIGVINPRACCCAAMAERERETTPRAAAWYGLRGGGGSVPWSTSPAIAARVATCGVAVLKSASTRCAADAVPLRILPTTLPHLAPRNGCTLNPQRAARRRCRQRPPTPL